MATTFAVLAIMHGLALGVFLFLARDSRLLVDEDGRPLVASDWKVRRIDSVSDTAPAWERISN